MKFGGDTWITFEIDVKSISGRNYVQHRLSSAISHDNAHPKQCHFIQITSLVGRTSKTISVHDAVTCAQNIPLRWQSYRGSTLSVIIQQTPNAEKETYSAHHVPGPPLRGACRLNPLISELEAWRYLASNVDVAEAYGVEPEAARRHYQDYGRYENRSLTFEPLYYLASHPDLGTLGEDEIAACKHFIETGRREGRQVSFEPKLYIERNTDLRATVGDDERDISLHYLRYGRQEGRPIK